MSPAELPCKANSKCESRQKKGRHEGARKGDETR